MKNFFEFVFKFRNEFSNNFSQKETESVFANLFFYDLFSDNFNSRRSYNTIGENIIFEHMMNIYYSIFLISTFMLFKVNFD